MHSVDGVSSREFRFVKHSHICLTIFRLIIKLACENFFRFSEFKICWQRFLIQLHLYFLYLLRLCHTVSRPHCFHGNLGIFSVAFSYYQNYPITPFFLVYVLHLPHPHLFINYVEPECILTGG